MSALPRCHLCKHRPGQRITTVHQATKGPAKAIRNKRKKPCTCECHS